MSKRTQKKQLSRIIAALDSHQWLITDEALAGIYEIAHRFNDIEAFRAEHESFDVETLLVGHEGRLPGARNALVAGSRAIIPIIGPIFPRANLMTEFSGATSISTVAADTRTAVNAGLEPVLYISTPGGVVEGVSEYAKMVAGLGIDAVVSGQCTSAGYWIASQCKSITAADTAVIGNIGAKGPNPKASDDDSLVSQHAPNKKATPAMVQGVLNQIETVFIEAVARGRGVTTEHVIESFGGGGVFVGQQALEIGMVDRVGTLEDYLKPQSAKAITTGTITMDPNKDGDMTVAEHEEKLAEAKAAMAAETTAKVEAAKIEGATAERERISAIMEAGKDKPVSAHNIAFSTDMTIDQATAFLEKQPAEALASDPLATAMQGVTNPDISADGDDSQAAAEQVNASWDASLSAVGA